MWYNIGYNIGYMPKGESNMQLASVRAQDLKANANKEIPYMAYAFKGSLEQMAAAANAAWILCHRFGIGGGKTYVYTKKAYEEVVSYLREHQVDGYQQYE